MANQYGEQFTLSTDPLLVLMAREAETVEDELDAQHEAEVRESVLLAATFFVNYRSTSKE